MSEIEIVGGLMEHYTQVPNEIFRTPGIRSRAVHVFGNLRSHRSGWKTNIRNVAQSTGLSNNTVMAAINDLIELGYIERQELPGARGRFATYKYRVLDVPCLKNEDRKEPSQKVRQEPSQKVRQEPVSKSKTLKKNSSKNTTKEDQREGASAPAADAPPPATSKRLARELPENWRPDPHVWEQMAQQRPDVDLELEHAKFCDYWPSQPGSRSRKKDWNATWRNWIRNARAAQSGGGQSKNTLEAWGYTETGSTLPWEDPAPTFDDAPFIDAEVY